MMKLRKNIGIYKKLTHFVNYELEKLSVRGMITLGIIAWVTAQTSALIISRLIDLIFNLVM